MAESKAKTDAKDSAHGLTDRVKAAGEKMRASGEKLAESGTQLGMKMLDQAEQNTREAFNAMRAAAKARDLSEVMHVQGEYLREQESREEEARQLRAAQRRHAEREQEEAYWRQCQEQEWQQAMDEQYAGAMQEQQEQTTEGGQPSDDLPF